MPTLVRAFSSKRRASAAKAARSKRASTKLTSFARMVNAKGRARKLRSAVTTINKYTRRKLAYKKAKNIREINASIDAAQRMFANESRDNTREINASIDAAQRMFALERREANAKRRRYRRTGSTTAVWAPGFNFGK
jgi:hypothetical protein